MTKKLVKLAAASQHKNINDIYFKQKFCQQSKLLRTKDLNTTHFILFKSPHDVQQVEFLGQQQNLTNFLNKCY